MEGDGSSAPLPRLTREQITQEARRALRRALRAWRRKNILPWSNDEISGSLSTFAVLTAYFPDSIAARDLFEMSLTECERIGGEEGRALAAAYRMHSEALREVGKRYPRAWLQYRRLDAEKLMKFTGDTAPDLTRADVIRLLE
jgi:inactivated superfamily I helicase